MKWTALLLLAVVLLAAWVRVEPEMKRVRYDADKVTCYYVAGTGLQCLQDVEYETIDELDPPQ